MQSAPRPFPQPASQVVDVARLLADDTFPRGSRPKQWYVVDGNSGFSFLKGGHRYMFKESVQRSPAQYWSEVVAWAIGELCGVTVPPAFVAVHGGRNIPGAFIEFFLQYPGCDPTERLTHAVDHLPLIQPNFDDQRGSNHNLKSNIALATLFERRYGLVGGQDFFARALVFDALIGNTDRHQENWGFVWSDYNLRQKARIAPAFDNGTSLGYELPEPRLAALVGDRLDHYISRGRHQMRYDQQDLRPALHIDLCTQFARNVPFAIPKMLSVLDFREEDLRSTLEHLTTFSVPVPLSPQRAQFMLRATVRRRELIGRALSDLRTE